MKNNRKVTLIATVTAALSLFGLIGCAGNGASPATEVDSESSGLLPDDILEQGHILVGTEAGYPPYTYFAEDNTTVAGMDPDIMHAVASQLGTTAEVEHTAWDGLLPALTAGRYDMVVGGISVTDERLEVYDFVTYFSADQAFTSPIGNPQNLSELEEVCGKSIAVQEAGPQEHILVDYNDDMCSANPIDVQAFAADSDALLQVRNGRADLHFAQRPVANYNAEFFGEGEEFEVLDLGPIEPNTIGLLFRKDTPELRDAVHAGLQELIDSGEYAELLEEFGQADGAIEQTEVITESQG